MAKIKLTDFLPVAGSIFDTVFGALFGSHQQDRQFEMQKELMDKAQQQGFENMDYQQRLSKDTFNYTFGREASLNESLMHNSPSIQKQAMIDAGINPASNFGSFSGNLAQSSAPTYTPQGSAPSAPSAPPVSSSLGQSLRSLAEIPLLREQTELMKEQAREKKLDNDAKQEVNDVFSDLSQAFEFRMEGDKLVYTSKTGDKLPEVTRRTLHTADGVKALNNGFREMVAHGAELDARESQARLNKRIADTKNCPEIVYKIANLEPREYDKLFQEWQNLVKDGQLKGLQIKYDEKRNEIQLTEKAMKELEYKIRENTNIVSIIERLVGGNFGIKDVLLGIAFAFMNAR